MREKIKLMFTKKISSVQVFNDITGYRLAKWYIKDEVNDYGVNENSLFTDMQGKIDNKLWTNDGIFQYAITVDTNEVKPNWLYPYHIQTINQYAKDWEAVLFNDTGLITFRYIQDACKALEFCRDMRPEWTSRINTTELTQGRTKK